MHSFLIAGLVGLLAIGIAAESLGLFPALAFAVQFNPTTIPSTTAVPPDVIAAGSPVMSVYADPRDLFDPEQGILSNRTARGSDWERPALLSYFDRSRLMFTSAVGLRVHGGKSREHSPVPSFRIRFAGKWRASTFRPDTTFGWSSYPVKRLVLHNDLREDLDGNYWHFVNPLAYDISRQIGSITPQTFPVRMFLNGESQGAYVVTEHLTTDGFLKGRFGHANFEQETTGDDTRLWRWAHKMKPITMAEVSREVDVENLTRWAISILFCATTDTFQGLILRDTTNPEARWFTVNWDMDHSFMDLYQRASLAWKHNTFETLLNQRDGRSELLTRLLAEDELYREYFKRTLIDTLNHRITPEFLNERFDHYARLVDAFGVEHRSYLALLQDYLVNRPQYLRQLTANRLKAGQIIRVDVRAPAGAELWVDRQRVGSAYTGWYYKGMNVRVEAIPAPGTTVSHWMIDGRKQFAATPAIEFPLEQDMSFDAVMRTES